MASEDSMDTLESMVAGCTAWCTGNGLPWSGESPPPRPFFCQEVTGAALATTDEEIGGLRKQWCYILINFNHL